MTANIKESQVTKPQADDNVDDVVLFVQGVSKKFCRSLKRSLFYGVQDIASELVGVRKDNNQLRKGEFWALKDVSFELKRGESLGLVGANGSGKTTLLRIISGLIKPDTGSVKITGRVAPLIALGAGFNPILTGRENIYVNMSILGLSKAEIDECFDEVVDFAEIGDAIDAPVQTYSSGMAARLGFACAIHTDPDILLIDEVLSVGDVKFRSKCYRKLAELQDKNISFILVSHNAEAILAICKSALYLLKGCLILFNDVELVLNKYEEDIYSQNEREIKAQKVNSNLSIDIAKITNIFFRNSNKDTIDFPISGQSIYLCIECFSYQVLKEVCVRLSLKKQGQLDEVLFLNNFHDNQPMQILKGNNEIQIYMPYIGLIPGLYNLSIGIHQGLLFQLDIITSFKFKVQKPLTQDNFNRSIYYQERQWNVSHLY